MRGIPLTPDVAEILDLGEHEGYFGVFTRNQYPGALPNGSRVRKFNSERGDNTRDGVPGTIMGSIGHPELPGIMYFVEWDNRPGVVIGCMDTKLEPDND